MLVHNVDLSSAVWFHLDIYIFHLYSNSFVLPDNFFLLDEFLSVHGIHNGSGKVEKQLKDLMANNLIGINIVPVQQQGNGSDCGVFSIAFATCIVYGRNPSIVTFDVPQM